MHFYCRLLLLNRSKRFIRRSYSKWDVFLRKMCDQFLDAYLCGCSLELSTSKFHYYNHKNNYEKWHKFQKPYYFSKSLLSFKAQNFRSLQYLEINYSKKKVMSCCQNCKEKQTKYKILQSDLQFELKKISQDLANEKVALELQYQKESKKAIEKYKKERNQRDDQNKNWMKKYDEIVGQYESQINSLRLQEVNKQKEYETNLITQLSQQEKRITSSYQQAISSLKTQHSSLVSDLKTNFKRSCQNAKKTKEQEINRLNTKHDQEIQETVTSYENKIAILKQEITNELTNIDKLKLEAHQKQKLLYDELFQKKQEIGELKYTTDKLTNKIKSLQEQIRFKNLEIQVLKEDHQQKLNKIYENYKTQKNVLLLDFQTQMQHFLKERFEECSKYEKVVQQIQQKRQNEIKIYQTSLNQVRQFVEDRPSRQEDVEEIQTLKELLNQKQRQFQKALSQAKGYRLQLNNKQQVFNKIFTNKSPLNIQKIGKKRQYKLPRTSSSNLKDNKYQSINTVHTLSSTHDFTKKEKLTLQPRSTKFF